MAVSEDLARQVETILAGKKVEYEVMKMMGGLCYIVDEKMCLGVSDNLMMARIDPDVYDDALTRPGCSAMDFTGRPMRGFVFIAPDEAGALDDWVQLCLDFNPKAKKSRKRKKA